MTSATEPDPLLGRLLDHRYRLEEQIGRGGMGIVYRAQQVAIERDVAVKVVRSDRLNDREAARGFLREARACSAIHHPNVVTLHDFGRDEGGLLYLVMEYIRGDTLAARVRRREVTTERAIAYAAQICAGLAAVHRQGLVHRDLSPRNVVVCSLPGLGEVCKILDFGLALRAGVTPQRVRGSPAYMSPEQIAGASLDARSDIYSVGAILYELLTGAPPFGGEDVGALLDAHLNTPSPALSALPEPLGALVGSCLAKEPAERPASATALRAALLRLSTGRGAARSRQEHSETLEFATPGPETTEPGDTMELLPTGHRVLRVVATRGSGELVEALGAATLDSLPVRIRRIQTGDRWSVRVAMERWVAPLVGLRHERLVTLRDARWTERELLLVHDPLPGVSLEATLHREGRLPWRRAVRVALALCEGLSALHDRQLLHQDLRPRTTRLLPDGRVALADAGLWSLRALPLYAPEEERQALAWKAPEQLEGAASGPEGDLYAVGLLIRCALTGVARPPAALGLASGRPVESLAGQIPGLPAALDALLQRLLASAPRDRPRSAAAAYRELEAILIGEQSPAASPWQDLAAEGALHGRLAERQELRSRVLDAAEGDGALLVVEGESGVGKSRLLEQTAELARERGFLVMRSAPHAGAGASPRRGLQAMLAQMDPALEGRADREQIFEDIRRAVHPLGALLKPQAPIFEEIFAAALPLAPVPAEVDAARWLRATSALMAALCETSPVLLVFEDLHWQDEATCRWLERAARTALGLPLLILCSAWPEAGRERTDQLIQWGGERMSVAGLDAAAVEALLRERLGDLPEIAEIVGPAQAITAGNPAALRALLRTGEEAGLFFRVGDRWAIDPSRLPDLSPRGALGGQILRQVEGLSEPTRRLMRIAAIWEASFDPSLLAALSDGELGDDAIAAGVAEALRAGVLAPAGDRWDFSHDLFRAAARDFTDDSAALHRRAADLLAQSDDPPLHQLVSHLLQTRPEPRDLPWLRSAAAASLQAREYIGASKLLRQALALAPADQKGALYRQLSESLDHHRGDLKGNIEAIQSAIALEAEASEIVPMLIKRSRLEFACGEHEQSLALHREALAQIDYRPPRSWLVRALWRGLTELALAPLRSVGASVDDRAALIELALSARVELTLLSSPAQALPRALEALSWARRSGLAERYAQGLARQSFIFAQVLGRPRFAERLLAQARRCAPDEPDLRCQLDITALYITWAKGQTDRVFEQLPELIERVKSQERPLLWILLIALRGRVGLFQGRIEDNLTAALELANDVPDLRSEDLEAQLVWSLMIGSLTQMERTDLVARWLPEVRGKMWTQAVTGRIFEMHWLLHRLQRNDLGGLSGEIERMLERTGRVGRLLWSELLCQLARGLRDALVELPADHPERPALRRALGDVIERARRVCRPYQLAVQNLEFVGIDLDLDERRERRARRRLANLVAQVERREGSELLAAHVLLRAGQLAGGQQTPDGRALLERAWARAALADDVHPLKLQIARAAGREDELGGDFDRAWAPLERLMERTTLRPPRQLDDEPVYPEPTGSPRRRR